MHDLDEVVDFLGHCGGNWYAPARRIGPIWRTSNHIGSQRDPLHTAARNRKANRAARRSRRINRLRNR